MLGILTRLVGGAIQPLVDRVSTAGARLLRKAALFLVAGLCLVVVLIALTLAFAFFISTKYGAIVAALAVAGVYLLVALVAVVLAIRDPASTGQASTGQASTGQASAAADKPATAAQDDARTAALDAQVDAFAAPILAFLDQLGLRRERFAVMAGASAAKQLGPIPLVGLAIVGGFLVGRMWKTWRALLSVDAVSSLLASGLFGLGAGRRGTDADDQARADDEGHADQGQTDQGQTDKGQADESTPAAPNRGGSSTA